MNGCVDIVEYLVKEHGVSVNTAAVPVEDVPEVNILVSEHINNQYVCISCTCITSL